MRPELIVMLCYWAFGAWIYSIGTKARQGVYKSEGAHVITVFPTKKTDTETYNRLYVDFHKKIMLFSLAMGALCAFAKGLLPIIFSSLVFFAFLNFFKHKTEEKLRAICE